MLGRLWLPDLFFANEKIANFHKVTQENKLVRIYKNGDIYISVRKGLIILLFRKEPCIKLKVNFIQLLPLKVKFKIEITFKPKSE